MKEIRVLKYILLLNAFLVLASVSTSLKVEPARSLVSDQAYPWGRHPLAFVYYASYIYDDHEPWYDFWGGEWVFQFYRLTEKGELVLVDWDRVEGISSGEYVDHKDLWWMGSTPNFFRLSAYEEDSGSPDKESIANLNVNIPEDWGNYYPVEEWIWQEARVRDTNFLWGLLIYNRNPTASLADRIVNPDVPITLSGTASDPDQDTISGYEWDFSYDGVNFNIESTEQNPTPTFTEGQVYTVGFRVKDYFSKYSSIATATITPTHVIIDKTLPIDARRDLSTNQTVGFHAKWAHNGTDINEGTIYVNGTAYTTNHTGWISFDQLYDTVGKLTWNVTAVDCAGIIKYEQAVADAETIWDKVTITLFVSSERIDVGSKADVTWTAVYQYPNVEDYDGIIELNDTLTKSVAGEYFYTVSSIKGDSHNIAAFESNTVRVIFAHPIDTDGDGIPDTIDTDDDNDGMPDTWEIANGLNPLDASDAPLDPDGDGITNLQEYQRGTNPKVSDAAAFPLWIIGAIAAVLIGIAVTATVIWKKRK